VRVPFELEIERTVAAQHIVENVGCDAAGGETWDLGGCTSCRRCHEVPS
jgi:hypothetical protein